MKEIVPSLLPSQRTLQLNSWELDETATHMTVHATSIQLAQDFTGLVRQRKPKKLDTWLKRAFKSSLSPIQRFALRLQSDYDSVKAGVTFSVSNGPVEGHINRLKMLKRQMYGRANLDLLSRRFLIKI